MKVYEVLITENSTYRAYINANSAKEAKEQVELERNGREKCINCSWEVEVKGV